MITEKLNQHALINLMLPKKKKEKKKVQPNHVLVRPTEKVCRTSATSGKNESRALFTYDPHPPTYEAYKII